VRGGRRQEDGDEEEEGGDGDGDPHGGGKGGKCSALENDRVGRRTWGRG
jgi:hypothetical protein